jgi:hypothetical protein
MSTSLQSDTASLSQSQTDPPVSSTIPRAFAVRQEEQKQRNRRASRACACCRTRKVRCDMVDVGHPCTNCRLDKYECEVPARRQRRSAAARRRRQQGGTEKRARDEQVESMSRPMPSYTNSPSHDQGILDNIDPNSSNATGGQSLRRIQPSVGLSSLTLPQHAILHQVPHYRFLCNYTSIPTTEDLDPDINQQSLMLLSNLRNRSGDDGESEVASRIDADEILFLKEQGAMNLPDRHIMNELISCYFRFIHPFFPVIDKTAFLYEFNRIDGWQHGNRLSLLLLQAVLFSSCGVREMFPASINVQLILY